MLSQDAEKVFISPAQPRARRDALCPNLTRVDVKREAAKPVNRHSYEVKPVLDCRLTTDLWRLTVFRYASIHLPIKSPTGDKGSTWSQKILNATNNGTANNAPPIPQIQPHNMRPMIRTTGLI